MQPNERPISELFRLAALDYVDLDAAARTLEENKGGILSHKITQLAPMPVSRAEALVKASEEWRDYIYKMVEARTKANRAKVEVEFLRMKFMEQNSEQANARLERKAL